MSWELVSSAPLIFSCREFATAAECDELVRAGDALRQSIVSQADRVLCDVLQHFGVAHGAPGFRRVYNLPESRKLRAEFDLEDQSHLQESARAVLRRFEEQIGLFLNCASHDDEDSCVLNLTPGRDDDVALESGLHVDTYNDAQRRFATAILYLCDLGPDDGGQTVFPLAANAPLEAINAGRELLSSDCESTLEISDTTFPHVNKLEGHAARLLQSHACEGDLCGESAGVAVRPRKGSLMIFFTRSSTGKIDARSWHGSAAVAPHALKWTLQTFKSVPLGVDVEKFASERAASHLFHARDALPADVFRALRQVRCGRVFGAQELIEEEIGLLGTFEAPLRVFSAHVVAGPGRGELPHDCAALVLWPAAVSLAHHLASPTGPELADKRVVDVGCGCGLLGLNALARGARQVVFVGDSSASIELAKRNVLANEFSERAVFVQRSTDEDVRDLGSFDFVLASDTMYAEFNTATMWRRLQIFLDLLTPSGEACFATHGSHTAMSKFMRIVEGRWRARRLEGCSSTTIVSLWHLQQEALLQPDTQGQLFSLSALD